MEDEKEKRYASVISEVKKIRDFLEKQCTDDDERFDFIQFIIEGYCEHCGSNHLPCFCLKD